MSCDVLGEVHGDSGGAFHGRRRQVGVVFLGLLNALFDFANGEEILVEFAAIGRAQSSLQAARVIA